MIKLNSILPMFGPLNFRNLPSTQETRCLLCENLFNLKLCFDIFLKHLYQVHNLVISDVQNIYNLEKYLNYWKGRFDEVAIESLLPSVVSGDERYFLLSDLTKEDKKLRRTLRLEKALNAQETERKDVGFKRQCLFCRLEFEGTRQNYIAHLSEEHNLQLGNPQNLVFLDELLEKIESNFENLICLYCEKIFPDRQVLKEHMRKKIHKRINPQNHFYDKFYMVNYLDEEDGDEVNTDEDDQHQQQQTNEDADYSDWSETDLAAINCLFCSAQENDMDKLYLHMHTAHKFNFPQLVSHLDFYQRLKLVNYIRKQMHTNNCFFCSNESETKKDLAAHLKEHNHNELPEVCQFDQPEFYFPTYENDAFLYFLEDLD